MLMAAKEEIQNNPQVVANLSPKQPTWSNKSLPFIHFFVNRDVNSRQIQFC